MKARRTPRRLALALAVLLAGMFIGPAHARAAATEGRVLVDGVSWSQPAEANLKSMNGGTPTTVEGEQVEVFNILQVLEQASSSPDLNIATLPRIEIAYLNSNGTSGKVSYPGDQIRNSPNSLAKFFVADGFTKMLIPGSSTPIVFEKTDAKLLDPTKQASLAITLDPEVSKIKSGQSVTFNAKVNNANGAPVTYRWDFGDGKGSIAGKATMTRAFTGKDRSFNVVVTASATGFKNGSGGAQVIIGKVKPPKNRPKKNDKKNETPAGNGGGYTGGTGYGTGTGGYGGYPGGTGTNPGYSPSTPSAPTPRKPEENPEPPVDDGLVEVTGELVSSSAPASTSPPGGSSAPETPATVTSPSSGGGIADWVLVVLGLGVLLGFGALVERRGSRLT